MSYQLLCTILFFFTSIVAKENHDRLPKRDICFQQGSQCSDDCTKVLFCISGGESPIVSADCSADNQTCFSNSSAVATCSSTDSDCATPGGGSHKCREDGDFPDPYNCRRGYTCGNGASTSVEECLCPPGSVWNTPRSECSTDPDAIQSCCRDFEVDCEKGVAGNFGECPYTASGYYYICDRSSGHLEVLMARCRSGYFFNSTTYSCQSLPVQTTIDIPQTRFVSNWLDSTKVKKGRPFCEQSKFDEGV